MDYAFFSLARVEVALLLLGLVTLLTDLFVPRSCCKVATHTMACLSVFGALIALFSLPFTTHTVGLNGFFVQDAPAYLLKAGILLSGLAAFIFARKHVESLPGEFYSLALLALLGMLVLTSAANLLTLYLGLELLSLPLYALVALQRDVKRASEAAMKYFITGALASGMLLYGMSILYGVTKSLDLFVIQQATTSLAGEEQLLFVLGLVFMLASAAFKLGVAPFHMWLPDVYEGAPLPTTLLIVGATKIAAVSLLFRIVITMLPALALYWQQVLVVLAALSIALGNLVALCQTDLRRMLAFSAIAQLGYTLLGFIAHSASGFSASLFYILTYSALSVTAFGCIAALDGDTAFASLDDCTGLAKRQPLYAAVLMILMFSFAGIPPFVGFSAKLLVLQAAIAEGQVALAILAMAFAVVGAFYYLRVIKNMYFDTVSTTASIASIPLEMQVLALAGGMVSILLGLWPNLLYSWCVRAI